MLANKFNHIKGYQLFIIRSYKESRQKLTDMYYVALAYAANLGGTGFPTGTGPNLVIWAILEK